MSQTKTDYSKNWKHYDVTRLRADRAIPNGHLVYSISGNSFGDQIIHYRRYQWIREDEIGSWFGLVTLHSEVNQEGSWISEKEIKATAKRVSKERKLP